MSLRVASKMQKKKTHRGVNLSTHAYKPWNKDCKKSTHTQSKGLSRRRGSQQGDLT